MSAGRRWIGIAALTGAVVGALGALALTSRPQTERHSAPPAPPSGHGPPAQPTGELALLRTALEAQSESVRVLTREVAQLQSDVEALRTDVDRLHGEDAEPPRPEARASEPAAAAASRAWFDATRLEELGATPGEVERLRELYEQNQLEVLYLRDRATRAGWMGTPRYHKELRTLESSLHEQLGDRDYDLLRYASGRPNRVIVEGVFSDSPAEQAGLRDGDAILRYGDRAIFTPQDLRRATSAGRAGATVAVDVLRGDASQRLYLPRGPLGARLRAERRPPQARW